jgi:hypothetical protein
MSKVTVTIELSAWCSYVSEPDLDDHLRGIAADFERYAKEAVFDDWNRKYQIDYETQEDVNLEITTDVQTA